MFSPVLKHEFPRIVPIIVDVLTSDPPVFDPNDNRDEPEPPSRELQNVALTVYYVGDTEFRIAATNVSLIPFNELTVQWWALGV
jgi:hypothetical protein